SEMLDIQCVDLRSAVLDAVPRLWAIPRDCLPKASQGDCSWLLGTAGQYIHPSAEGELTLDVSEELLAQLLAALRRVCVAVLDAFQHEIDEVRRCLEQESRGTDALRYLAKWPAQG